MSAKFQATMSSTVPRRRGVSQPGAARVTRTPVREVGDSRRSGVIPGSVRSVSWRRAGVSSEFRGPRRSGSAVRHPGPASIRRRGASRSTTSAAGCFAHRPVRSGIARRRQRRRPRCWRRLAEIDGETHVVFIKRPETMSTHKGEIAFPGGKFDPAVRHRSPCRGAPGGARGDRPRPELRRHRRPPHRCRDRRVCVLDHARTSAFCAATRARAATRRRSCGCSRCPLAELFDPSIYREERWDGFQRDMSVYFFELPDETVWGATARILTDLLARRGSSARAWYPQLLIGERQTMDIEEFYSADERRRHSAELEFGRDWNDDTGRCGVSWVADTGELYLMREPNAGVWGDGSATCGCGPSRSTRSASRCSASFPPVPRSTA